MSVEVVGYLGGKHHLLLNDKRCTFKVFDRTTIP